MGRRCWGRLEGWVGGTSHVCTPKNPASAEMHQCIDSLGKPGLSFLSCPGLKSDYTVGVHSFILF